jgi:hypothetical protein
MRGRRCCSWAWAWLWWVLLRRGWFLVVLLGMAGWRWMDGLWMWIAGTACDVFGHLGLMNLRV